MGTQSLNTAIENLFNTQWSALHSTITIKFDNVDFEVPTTSWVSIEVWDGDSMKASLGSGTQLRRTLGTVFITLFVPKSSGTRTIRGYVDDVKGIFRDIVVSGITFLEGSTSRLGEYYYPATGGGTTGSAQWFQMKVAIPFKYDEFL